MSPYRFLLTSGLTLTTVTLLAAQPAAARHPHTDYSDPELIAAGEWARSLTQSKMWPYNVQGASMDWYTPACAEPAYAAPQADCPTLYPGPSPAVGRAPVDAPAHINVRVAEGATLWIDGVQTTPTGTLRRFVSPRLIHGGQYNYDIRASGQESGRVVTQRRQVIVYGGDRVDVDLTPPTPAPVAATPPTPAVEGNVATRGGNP